jgi:hypothetical protein
MSEINFRDRVINHRFISNPQVMVAAAQAQLSASADKALGPKIDLQRRDAEQRVRSMEGVETQKDRQIRRAVGARAWSELEGLKRDLRAKLPERPKMGEEPSRELIAAVRSNRAEFSAKARALGVDLDKVRRIDQSFNRRVSALQRPKVDTRLGAVHHRWAPQPIIALMKGGEAEVFEPPFPAAKTWNETLDDNASLNITDEVADAENGVLAASSEVVLPGDEDYEQGLIRWNGSLLFAFKTPSAGFPQVIVTLTPRTLCSLFFLGMDRWGFSSTSIYMSQSLTALWLDPFSPENTQAASKTLVSLSYVDDEDWVHESASVSSTQVVQLVGDKPVEAGTNYIVAVDLGALTSARSNDYMSMVRNKADWRVDQVVALVD